MVRQHRPEAAHSIVVKSGAPRLHSSPKQHCVVCGCELRGDHELGDLVCDCHQRDGYNPRHDPKLDERILVLLWRAQGAPLNLYRALGCDTSRTNYDAVRDSISRLNASGVVRVVGVGAAGRRLAQFARNRVVKIKP